MEIFTIYIMDYQSWRIDKIHNEKKKDKNVNKNDDKSKIFNSQLNEMSWFNKWHNNKL